jgi:hypothetical protein
MEGYIGRELREKLNNPIIFQRKASAAGNTLSRIAHGYDATLLADLWNAIIAARKDGKLAGNRYDKMVNHAQRASESQDAQLRFGPVVFVQTSGSALRPATQKRN